ncbi:MAG: MltR family transcriptional regulator [Alphaproteobacteria bacterium]|nr:MltR family transcriptional regulator [Alphaproteobacteria bacterium]
MNLLTEKKISKDIPHRNGDEYFEDFGIFIDVFNSETDRGKVLIALSYIDELLRRTLLAFLTENDVSLKLVDGFNAPLGTLSTRNAIAYSLGLILDIEYQDIETLRKIRNLYAHNVHTSFENEKIINLCKNLRMAHSTTTETKERFCTSAIGIITGFSGRAECVHKYKLSPCVWAEK